MNTKAIPHWYADLLPNTLWFTEARGGANPGWIRVPVWAYEVWRLKSVVWSQQSVAAHIRYLDENPDAREGWELALKTLDEAALNGMLTML